MKSTLCVGQYDVYGSKTLLLHAFHGKPSCVNNIGVTEGMPHKLKVGLRDLENKIVLNDLKQAVYRPNYLRIFGKLQSWRSSADFLSEWLHKAYPDQPIGQLLHQPLCFGSN